MRKTHFAFAALAVTAVAALCAQAAPGQAPPAGANNHVLAVGVVNVTYVAHHMKEPQKLTQDLKAQSDQLAKEQQQRQQALSDLVKRRNDFKPGSAQYEKISNDIDDEQIKYQVWVATARAQLERQEKKNLKQIFDHIRQATAEVAQQMQLNLVVADQSPEIGPDLSRVSPELLQQALSTSAVLYADKKADITEEVLTRVEADYANAGVAQGK